MQCGLFAPTSQSELDLTYTYSNIKLTVFTIIYYESYILGLTYMYTSMAQWSLYIFGFGSLSIFACAFKQIPTPPEKLSFEPIQFNTSKSVKYEFNMNPLQQLFMTILNYRIEATLDCTGK